ncbi:MAG: ATP F0F1 synthase subunit I [Rhodomicrobium sp.]|nr:ATP F0F1 synthase subunit I [Rhodomicrobium sp.]
MTTSASGENGGRQGGEPDYNDIKKRLDSLGGKLGKVKKAGPSADDEAARGRGQAMGVAFRIATELVAGVFVGGFIGWLLDRWLGTAPILLIVFLLLGIAAGLLNSVRAAQKMQKNMQR